MLIATLQSVGVRFRRSQQHVCEWRRAVGEALETMCERAAGARPVAPPEESR